MFKSKKEITCAGNAVTTQAAVLKDLKFKGTLNFNCITTKNSGSTYRSKFSAGLLDYSSYIPGLKMTRTQNGCYENMVPQAVCCAGTHLLISAYDGDGLVKSVIYILDRETLKLQSTMTLNIKAHLGGIAYDHANGNLWVCDSKKGQMKMRVYKINVDDVVREGSYTYKEYDKTVDVDLVPSYCCIYDGMLWVGQFNEKSNCSLIGYTISGSNGYILTRGITFKELPNKVQGVGFYKDKQDIYLAATTSYGRKNNSMLYVYSVKNFDFRKNSMVVISGSKRKTVTLPSMAEGFVTYGNQVYMIFESAAGKYRKFNLTLGVSKNPCDRIIVAKASFIYEG